MRDALLAKKRLDKKTTTDDDDLRATWRAVLVEIIVKIHKMTPARDYFYLSATAKRLSHPERTPSTHS